MNFSLEYDQLSTFPVMFATAIAMAVGWGIIIDLAKKSIADFLSEADWWHNFALTPTKSMMANFGYPRQSTDKFPDGISEPMARDYYSFIVTIVTQHLLTALPMLPVLIYGWNDSDDIYKSLFLLGTLSDVGFDVYDCASCTLRCFQAGHPSPLPIETWFIVCIMHHTTALALVIPMNLKYPHRYEYHQTAVSLLMAAAICYGAGCYKFAIDIGKKSNFILYKLVVLFQLGIILYSRVYLWFPAARSFRSHLKEEGDTAFFFGASVMITIFSLFNLLLVIDGVKAVVKCIPKKFPKTKAETEETRQQFRRYSAGIDVGMGTIAEISSMLHRRKFRGAVNTVIAGRRMLSSLDPDSSSDDKGEKDD